MFGKTMAKNNEPESASINLIGAGTVIQGDIKTNGDIRIDGTLIGSLNVKGKLVVGVSGSLDDSFKQSKTFYILYGIQLLAAMLIAIFSRVSLFQIAVITQIINAVALPLVFYYLIKLTSDVGLMGDYVNNKFQKWFSIICSVVIVIASMFTVASIFF